MHQLNLTSESGEGEGGVGEEGGVDNEETAREVGEQEPDSVVILSTSDQNKTDLGSPSLENSSKITS